MPASDEHALTRLLEHASIFVLHLSTGEILSVDVPATKSHWK